MYVCMYVRVYVCMHVFMIVCMYVYAFCTYLTKFKCNYVNGCMFIIRLVINHVHNQSRLLDCIYYHYEPLKKTIAINYSQLEF